MPVKWISTDFKGVRYYESDTRKNGKRKDRYYAIRYQRDGNRIEEGLGWESDKWTAEKAALTLAELKNAHTTGEGPARLKEKREKEKARKETERQEKIRRERESITFYQYFENTYYPIAKTHKKEQTYIKEELHCRLWIDPILGKKELKTIKPFDLERLKKKLLEKDKSPRTVQYVFATFRQVWNMARRDGLVTEDSPSKKVKISRFDNKRQRFLSLDEEKDLLNELKERNPQVHNMTLLSLRTGMRASEIFNLKWGHVDIENGRILIMDAKGDKSRIAFMTEDIKQILDKQDDDKEHDEYVFISPKEDKYREMPGTFRTAVGTLDLNKGISDPRQQVCFHTCRHTFASRLAESGVDLYVIKNLLGHSTISLTERYSHLTEGTLQDAVRTLEQSLKQAQPDNLINMNSSK